MAETWKLATFWACSVALLVFVALHLDGDHSLPAAAPEVPDPPAMETIRRPHSPGELDIELDPSGRPYDADGASFWADRVEREFLTQFAAPGGEISIMDGSAIVVDPYAFREEAVVVTLPADEVDVFVHREFYEREDGEALDQFLALEVVVPGEVVESWDAFEFGYGTDGGQGGIVSSGVFDAAQSWAATTEGSGTVVTSSDGSSYLVPYNPGDDFFIDTDFTQEIEVHDLDGSPGSDTIVFSNGFGDGGLPMVRGRNQDGAIIAFVVFDNRYPWRLMFPSDSPPADVSIREDELAECLAGERDVQVWPRADGSDSLWCVPGSDA